MGHLKDCYAEVLSEIINKIVVNENEYDISIKTMPPCKRNIEILRDLVVEDAVEIRLEYLSLIYNLILVYKFRYSN